MDEYEEWALNEIKKNPSGISFNKLSKTLTGKVAPKTLRKKLDNLLKRKYIHQKPTHPRKGQSIQYFPTRAYNDYQSFLKELNDFSLKFSNTIAEEMPEIKSVETLKSYIKLERFLIKKYSLPVIVDTVNSWESFWLTKPEIMRDILLSYLTIYAKIQNVINLKSSTAEAVKIIQELLKEYPEKKEDTSQYGDWFDFLTLSDIRNKKSMNVIIRLAVENWPYSGPEYIEVE